MFAILQEEERSPDSSEAEPVTPGELLALECEILVSAALENAITEENAGRVRARIVAEAANGPVTPEADRILDRKEKVMTRAVRDVLRIHLERKVNRRLAANMLGVSRVAEACRIRGLYP